MKKMLLINVKNRSLNYNIYTIFKTSYLIDPYEFEAFNTFEIINQSNNNYWFIN
jgi:hypothetical protein